MRRLDSSPALLVVVVAMGVGGASSLPISLVEHAWLWRISIPQCDFACIAQFVFTRPAVAGALFASGALFGWAAAVVGAGSRVRAAIAGGGALYCAAFAAALATNWTGMWIDTLLFEHVFRGHYPEWLVVAVTFGVATAVVGGTVTLAVGSVIRTRSVLWRSLCVAAMLAVAYVSLGAALNLLPGWTIGLPERINNHAMPRVTFISDLVVGAIGAWFTLFMLERGKNHDVARADGR